MADTRTRPALAPVTDLVNRKPPHNLEAEQAILGSMFLSAEAVENTLSSLQPEDFYRPAHARIYRAIRHLYDRNVPIDQVSVADRLEAAGELDQAGGKAYLLDITGVVPTAANAHRYAEIVKRMSMLRQLIGAATHIVELGYEAPDDLTEVVEEAEKRIFDVTNQRVTSNFTHIQELLGTVFEELEDLFEHQRHVTGVPTGFEDLDRLLAGLHRGDLIILAARPSVGKTAFALNIAVNAAKAGTSVALFSLEMASDQLVQRVLCSEARVNSQDMRTGYVKEQDWTPISKAMARLAELDVHIDDTSSMSILELKAKARRLLRERPNSIVIVDYLQLMQPTTRRSENRQTEIAEISRGLKALAKDLSVPVLALSQLSRAVEQRAGKRPQLSDLRESGAIEQDADVVMFIDRNTDPRGSEDEDDRPPRGIAEIIVAKHRNGPIGSAKLAFVDRFAKFVDAAREPM
ncbi:MAG: replicative DNA helicase [Coriobacteriia bacterium]|nr:replicative DNA helicase [Coriobacteriia bacterium]